MDTSKIESVLRNRLLALQARLHNIGDDASKSYSNDSAEQAQERENDEVLDQIGNETKQSIAQITIALRRIADHKYGLCECCGEDISAGRLAIIPETTHCIDCAD